MIPDKYTARVQKKCGCDTCACSQKWRIKFKRVFSHSIFYWPYRIIESRQWRPKPRRWKKRRALKMRISWQLSFPYKFDDTRAQIAFQTRKWNINHTKTFSRIIFFFFLSSFVRLVDDSVRNFFSIFFISIMQMKFESICRRFDTDSQPHSSASKFDSFETIQWRNNFYVGFHFVFDKFFFR